MVPDREIRFYYVVRIQIYDRVPDYNLHKRSTSLESWLNPRPEMRVPISCQEGLVNFL